MTAPPPAPDEVFAGVGGLVEVVAFGLDGGDVLDVDEGLGDVVDGAACVGDEPVHDELGPGLAGAVVFWPVTPGGAELVVPWLGDVEGDAGGDPEGVVFGLPLGLLVGWSVTFTLAPGEAPPLEPAVLPLAGLLDDVTGGVAAWLVLPCVPVFEDATAGSEDGDGQGFGVR